jgi:MFS family permease
MSSQDLSNGAREAFRQQRSGAARCELSGLQGGGIMGRMPPFALSRRPWAILAASFATFAVGAAMMHSYTVFLLAFVGAFGWTRGETSIAYAISQLMSGVTSPLVGTLVDRLGPARLVLGGGVVLAFGLLASTQADALWHIILLYGVVMTLGANCLGMVVFVPMLSRMFVRQRGLAVAVLQSANGVARAVSAPAAQALVAAVGWRGAYLAEAGIMAALVLPLALLFRGAGAAPSAPAQAHSAAQARYAWTLRQAMRTPHFWLLFAVYLFTGLGSFLVALHQLAFAADIGFDKLYAATVIGLGAGLSLPGIIVTGALSDHIGRELSAVVTYGTSIFGVACALLITSPNQHLLLWLHACFFGLTWGARGPAITAKTADLFPGPNLGSILGVITIGTGLGAALGSWLAGLLFDLAGTYRLAFILSMVAYACGAVAFWALRRPPALPRGR